MNMVLDSKATLRTNAVKRQAPSAPILMAAASASAYCWLVFITTFIHPGAIGINYNSVGSDWLVFHGAARSYLEGHLTTVSGDRLTAFLNQSYGWWLSKTLPYRPWVYPPSYLLLVLPFGSMGLATSYVVFEVLTAGALVSSVVVGADYSRPSAKTIAACALLCPAAAINAVNGQNALLMGALLVTGIRLLQNRPLLAGLTLGVVTIKPQLAILVPIALIAAQQWRALFAACASALGLVLASGLVIGWDAWMIWLHQSIANATAPADAKWVEFGRIWGNSVWTCAILLGATEKIASTLQILSILLAAGAVGAAFRGPANGYTRLAVFLTAAILAAPHWSPYDAVLLVLAALFWLAQRHDRDPASWPWLLTLVLWFIPIISPPAILVAGRVVPVVIVGFLSVVTWPVLQRHPQP
jgi:glycosyl transferase family 87